MITKYPWFGPERGFLGLGWGWTPITWEGWAVTILFLAVVLGARLRWGRGPRTLYVVLGALVVFFGVIFLTGTAPG